MELIERATEPTPKFWRKVRNVSLLLASIGATIATAPISLPAILVTIGGYMATVGAVGATLSQLTSTER